MGVRHQGSSIEQRGHVYYWRPRLPPRLRAASGKARLTISLGQYDFRRACYIARRLALLLDEMEMTPGPVDITHDQLRRLFEGELARMREHLENVALIARRHGRGGNPEEVDLDLEMGWAYRILQYWGSAEHLTFTAGCPAHTVLIEAGIPDYKIERIGQLVRSEGAILRSTGFEHKITTLMRETGLPDTVIGRERAKIEWLRARADALLDVGSRMPIGRTAPPSEASAVPTISVSPLHAVASPLSISIGQTSLDPAARSSLDTKEQAWRESGSGDGTDLIDLPVSKFIEIGGKINEAHSDNWSTETKRDFLAFL